MYKYIHTLKRNNYYYKKSKSFIFKQQLNQLSLFLNFTNFINIFQLNNILNYVVQYQEITIKKINLLVITNQHTIHQQIHNPENQNLKHYILLILHYLSI